jgi:hypothetical protein
MLELPFGTAQSFKCDGHWQSIYKDEEIKQRNNPMDESPSPIHITICVSGTLGWASKLLLPACGNLLIISISVGFNDTLS